MVQDNLHSYIYKVVVQQAQRVYAGARPINRNWIGDTVNLLIDNKQIRFFELKGKTIDWYLFDLESLRSTDYKPGHTLIIQECLIREITKDSILCRLTMKLYNDKRTKKKKELKPIDSWTRDIWISNKTLDGVLTNKDEQEYRVGKGEFHP